MRPEDEIRKAIEDLEQHQRDPRYSLDDEANICIVIETLQWVLDGERSTDSLLEGLGLLLKGRA